MQFYGVPLLNEWWYQCKIWICHYFLFLNLYIQLSLDVTFMNKVLRLYVFTRIVSLQEEQSNFKRLSTYELSSLLRMFCKMSKLVRVFFTLCIYLIIYFWWILAYVDISISWFLYLVPHKKRLLFFYDLLIFSIKPLIHYIVFTSSFNILCGLCKYSIFNSVYEKDKLTIWHPLQVRISRRNILHTIIVK